MKSTKTKKSVVDTELLKLASDLLLALFEDVCVCAHPVRVRVWSPGRLGIAAAQVPLGVLGLLYLIYQYNVPTLLAVSLFTSGASTLLPICVPALLGTRAELRHSP